MQIIYLRRALADMSWVRRYYSKVFPQGRVRANEQLTKAEQIISENPLAGKPSENVRGAREWVVGRTPFSLVYSVKNNSIEILRVVDNRSNWAAVAVYDEDE